MKFWSGLSFKKRIFLGMILAAILPMLLGYLLTLESFSMYMDNSLSDEAEDVLLTVGNTMDMAFNEISRELTSLGGEDAVKSALENGNVSDDKDVYRVLFASTGRTGRFAYFSIYDTSGQKLMSALNNTYIRNELPLDYGILFGAGRSQEGCILRNARLYNGVERVDYLRMATRIKGKDKSDLGYAVATILSNNFDEMFSNIRERFEGPIYILDSFRELVYTTDADFNEDKLRQTKLAILDGQNTVENGDGYVFHINENTDWGTYLVYRQPVARMNVMGRSIVIIALIFAVISLLLCIFLSERFGNMLSISYNKLADDLKKNTDELIASERELSEVNIKMLQAQLNPHFLYNTLDTMKWIGKSNRVPEVASLSENLAGILRTAISENALIPLEREIGLVESYVKIQQIRFEDKFEFLIDSEDGLNDCLVPKLILQPVVENSLIHGLHEADKGTVFIRIQKQEVPVNEQTKKQEKEAESENTAGRDEGADRNAGRLRLLRRKKEKEGILGGNAEQTVTMVRITITDDGCGIDAETLAKIREKLSKKPEEKTYSTERGHASLGIYNVNSIIRLRYGKTCPVKCGLSIDSEEGHGTTVVITLPFTEQKTSVE